MWRDKLFQSHTIIICYVCMYAAYVPCSCMHFAHVLKHRLILLLYIYRGKANNFYWNKTIKSLFIYIRYFPLLCRLFYTQMTHISIYAFHLHKYYQLFYFHKNTQILSHIFLWMSQKHVSKIIFWTVLYKSSFTCIDSIFSLNLRLCTYISSKHVVWFRRLYKYYFGTVLWVYYTTITFVNHCRNWLSGGCWCCCFSRGTAVASHRKNLLPTHHTVSN